MDPMDPCELRKDFEEKVAEVFHNVTNVVEEQTAQRLFQRPGWQRCTALYTFDISSLSGPSAQGEYGCVYLDVSASQLHLDGLNNEDDATKELLGDKRLAVKILKTSNGQTPAKLLKGLIGEAAALHASNAALPRFVPEFHGFLVDKESYGQVILVGMLMEHVQALTCNDWLNSDPPPSLGQKWRFFCALACFCFWKSLFCIEHNDLHSKNVLVVLEKPDWTECLEPHLSNNAWPKIVDFGRVLLWKPTVRANVASSSQGPNTNEAGSSTTATPFNSSIPHIAQPQQDRPHGLATSLTPCCTPLASAQTINQPCSDLALFDDLFERAFPSNNDPGISDPYYLKRIQRVRAALGAKPLVQIAGPLRWVAVVNATKISVNTFHQLAPKVIETPEETVISATYLELLANRSDSKPEGFWAYLCRVYEEQTGKPRELSREPRVCFADPAPPPP